MDKARHQHLYLVSICQPPTGVQPERDESYRYIAASIMSTKHLCSLLVTQKADTSATYKLPVPNFISLFPHSTLAPSALSRKYALGLLSSIHCLKVHTLGACNPSVSYRLLCV